MDENFDAVDALIEWLRRNTPEKQLMVMNPERMRDLYECGYRLRAMLLPENPDTVVSIDARPPELGDGCAVRVECDSLIAYNPAQFWDAVRKADNFEFYPLVNGKLRMALMFYHCYILTPIE